MRSGYHEIVAVVLLIAIPLGTWCCVICPRNACAERIYQTTKIKQDELKALENTNVAIGDLEKEIAELSKAMAFFESKLPNEKVIDKVLHNLWQLAKSNDLVTKGIHTKDSKKPAVHSLINPDCDQPIVMQLEGNFMKFYAFLQALEDQPRIMRVRSMKVVEAKDAPEGSIKADFMMSVFFEAGDE